MNFGHPTSVTLQRILRRQHAKPEAIRAAGLLWCDACGESIRRKRPKPVRLPNRYEFNRHLMLDTFYAKDVTGDTYGFLNIVDDATNFQVVACFGTITGPPASRAVLRHFTTSWTSWAGLPHSIQVDRGKEFMALFADHLKQFGVEQEVMPLEAPWKGGRCEKAGDLWKQLWNKVVLESEIAGMEDVLLAASIVTQTRNSFPRTSGYSPLQWVLGTPELRFPGSLLDEDEAKQLEVMEHAEDPSSQMARTLTIRENAKVAQIRLDTDSRVRRALLRKSTPTRGPYPVGAYVYFYKVQPQHQEGERPYKWFGPARVIGVELRNPRRLEDEDMPTEGGQPHSYWLRYGHTVVLATGEQLRFASEDELLAAHCVPHYAVSEPQLRGARSFVDVRPFGGTSMDTLEEEVSAPAGGVGVGGAGGLAGLPTIEEEGDYVPTTPPDPMDDIPVPGPAAPQDELLPQQGEEVPETPFPGTAPRSRTGTDMEPEPQPLHSRQPSSASHGQLPIQLPPQPTAELYQHLPPVPFSPFRDPDRLDGHGPMRRSEESRREGREAGAPYFAEVEPWEGTMPDLSENLRKHRIRELQDFEDENDLISEESETFENDEVSDKDTNPVIAFSYMTGKAATRSEVSLKHLSPEDRRLFDDSMAKEWTSWQKFGAVEELDDKTIANLPKDTKIIGTRWVHTDKNSKNRLVGYHMMKRTGKTKAQVDREFPFQAKSRLVVQGCQEDETGIRSDSPTASLLAFNLVCAVATLQGWILGAYDASTAYLQSRGIERLLILRAPRPPPPGVAPSALFRAKGSIYGTKDAGRSWWKKLLKDSRQAGWILSKIEPALFYFYNKKNEFAGIMISHVDDLFVAGEGEEFQQAMDWMTGELHLKKKTGEFRFCGKNIIQDKNGIVSIEQVDAIEGIEYQLLEKHRRKMVNATLTDEEKSGYRALIGSMGWVTRQSRPDVMVNVSLASQAMGNPKVKDVIDLNKAVKMLKESADFKWRFKPSEITLDNCVVFVCADSSFANVEGHKSQCGFVMGLTLETIPNGELHPVMILETSSSSIKRVCRSTLAAEANSVLTGVEAGCYVSSVLRELMNPGVALRILETEYVKKPVVAFTDAKSLEATIVKDAGQPTDKRVKILVAQIKELINHTNGPLDDNVVIYWVDTSQMVADVLTKIGCERELLQHVLSEGCWQLLPTQKAIEKKQAIRDGRHKRKAKKKTADDAAEDG